MDHEKIKESEIEKFIESYELRRLHVDFFERLIILAIAGLGLITALAWDEAFKYIFEHYFGALDDMTMKFVYALILTVITAAVTVRLNKIVKRRRK